MVAYAAGYTGTSYVAYESSAATAVILSTVEEEAEIDVSLSIAEVEGIAYNWAIAVSDDTAAGGATAGGGYLTSS